MEAEPASVARAARKRLLEEVAHKPILKSQEGTFSQTMRTREKHGSQHSAKARKHSCLTLVQSGEGHTMPHNAEGLTESPKHRPGLVGLFRLSWESKARSGGREDLKQELV